MSPHRFALSARLLILLLVFIVPVVCAVAQQKRPAVPKKLAIAVLDFDTRGGMR